MLPPRGAWVIEGILVCHNNILTFLIDPIYHLMMPGVRNRVAKGHGLLEVQRHQGYGTFMEITDKHNNYFMTNITETGGV